MKYVDINCDMGENKGDDKAVISYISSANIACGGHAGDIETMKRTIDLALENGVRPGAHPGYSDPDNFGRVETGASFDEILDDVLNQLSLFKDITDMSHIKFHGALYNRAAADNVMMTKILKSIIDEFGYVPIYTLAGSVSEQAVLDAGCMLYKEGFADRAYDDTGRLVSRMFVGAVLDDEEYIAQRALDIVNGVPIKSISGKKINIQANTICVHGDTPGALGMAVGIHSHLKENSIFIGRYDAL